MGMDGYWGGWMWSAGVPVVMVYLFFSVAFKECGEFGVGYFGGYLRGL